MKNKWVSLNIAAILLVLLVNALATILPINGQTTADVSDSYPVLFNCLLVSTWHGFVLPLSPMSALLSTAGVGAAGASVPSPGLW